MREVWSPQGCTAGRRLAVRSSRLRRQLWQVNVFRPFFYRYMDCSGDAHASSLVYSGSDCRQYIRSFDVSVDAGALMTFARRSLVTLSVSEPPLARSSFKQTLIKTHAEADLGRNRGEGRCNRG